MSDSTLGEIAAELTSTTDEVRLTPYEAYTVCGDPDAKPGKVYCQIGAGWLIPPHLFKLACEAGIDTAVLVNSSSEHYALAKKHGINIFEVPHNSNDNSGINQMLDALQRDGPLEIYEADNFFRPGNRGC
jgi:hypothetical protein